MCQDTRRCPNGTIAVTADRAVKLIPAFCGSWSCSQCGPRKARRLRGRIARTNPSRFLTLTLKPSPGQTASQLLAIANRAWSILWRRIRRRFPHARLGYAKIIELTKAGTPHLHILVESPYIPQTWISAQWRELTGSYIVDIRKVGSRRALVGYLTAYLTKAMEVPKGHRKWSASARWVPPEEEKPLEEGEIPPSARYLGAHLAEVRIGYVLAGWKTWGDWLVPASWNVVFAPG